LLDTFLSAAYVAPDFDAHRAIQGDFQEWDMAEMRPGLSKDKTEAVGEQAALDRLSRRIDTARESMAPPPKKAPGKYQGLSIAWRMVLELVIGCGFGAAIGYAIDEVAGTRPLFLVVFGLLGFAAGVRTMMASARQMQRKRNEGDDLGG